MKTTKQYVNAMMRMHTEEEIFELEKDWTIKILDKGNEIIPHAIIIAVFGYESISTHEHIHQP